MFGIRYIKFDAMDYVIHYQNGKIKREGQALNFFYFEPASSIVCIPLKSSDLGFVFRETTSDFQEVTVQGQLSYRIAHPQKLAMQLDYTVDENKNYRTKDYEKLSQRIVTEAQTTVSAFIHSMNIISALSKQAEIEAVLLQGLISSKVLAALGIEIQGVSILGVSTNPEMSRALEAKTREELQTEADKAIYNRRNFAVEEERRIKESELNTQIAVEEKNKQIVEKRMQTDVVKTDNARKLKEMEMSTQIIIEEKNKELISMRTENDKKIADAEEYKLKAVMDVYKNIDWKILTALKGDLNAGDQIALGFRELAANSSKIENLNITPDLLEKLMEKRK